MKKILLLLMIVFMIGCVQTNEEYINSMIKKTRADVSLPYEGAVGTWSDIIN